MDGLDSRPSSLRGETADPPAQDFECSLIGKSCCDSIRKGHPGTEGRAQEGESVLWQRAVGQKRDKGLAGVANPLSFLGGRYWDRTSDLRRVKTAL